MELKTVEETAKEMMKYEYLDRTEKEWQTQSTNGVQWSDLVTDDEYYDVFDDYQRYDILNLERVGYNDFTYIDKNGEKHYVAVRVVKWL